MRNLRNAPLANAPFSGFLRKRNALLFDQGPSLSLLRSQTGLVRALVNRQVEVQQQGSCWSLVQSLFIILDVVLGCGCGCVGVVVPLPRFDLRSWAGMPGACYRSEKAQIPKSAGESAGNSADCWGDCWGQCWEAGLLLVLSTVLILDVVLRGGCGCPPSKI